MKSTHIGGALTLIILLAVGYWGYSTFNENKPNEYVVETPNGTSTMNATTGETTPTVKSFSAADIATHKDATSCYSSINGSVYDLTAWVNLHPGGKDKILSVCGVDGTARFMGMHKGGQKYLDILARFKIGVTS